MNDMSNLPQRPVFQPNDQVSATLDAQDWNVILFALNEAPLPMRVARALSDKIIAQTIPAGVNDVSD